ncbi:hypothetical protein N657DRAFT_50428 [Parathielavia appendiculata]|uniref:Uncharacterized protein n=1 Tax=Parathielavia appendiculata TaxID=2587402 RepID=A0AAN6U9M7_9PEZI|nr:hypothetical protein N657DRAFT_50428 [Parathielavia appendiculata]
MSSGHGADGGCCQAAHVSGSGCSTQLSILRDIQFQFPEGLICGTEAGVVGRQWRLIHIAPVSRIKKWPCRYSGAFPLSPRHRSSRAGKCMSDPAGLLGRLARLVVPSIGLFDTSGFEPFVNPAIRKDTRRVWVSFRVRLSRNPLLPVLTRLRAIPCHINRRMKI